MEKEPKILGSLLHHLIGQMHAAKLAYVQFNDQWSYRQFLALRYLLISWVMEG